MKSINNKIIISGINGFLGKALSVDLRFAGYEVWGIDIFSNDDKYVSSADLLDYKAVERVASKFQSSITLIHAAALAHNQKPPDGETVITTNIIITKNILKAFNNKIEHIIFFSSVSVYGEDKRYVPVRVDDDLRPSTKYGTSKLICEKIILNSNINNCDILRFAPVFDRGHMHDVSKRVFFPGSSSIKIMIKPSPSYSLTKIETAVKNVRKLLSNKMGGKNIINVCDEIPYNQNELSNRFKGKIINVHVIILKPFYWLTYLLPKYYGYKLRCYFWKLFYSNIYTA